MEYHFADFTLNIKKFELHRQAKRVLLEPQVFLLIKQLLENRDRMVTKDEIVAEIWNGRIVSDASIASRIKSARAALGDDGKAQHTIRTIHGQGFRFVADVTEHPKKASATAKSVTTNIPVLEVSQNTKPSIVVLPFRFLSPAGADSALSDAIPHDLIQAFCRLRWLFVIARGTAFRFRAPDPDVREIGKALNVRYVMLGSLEMHNTDLTVTVELSDTHNGGIVWTDRFSAKRDAVHQVREEIVAKVVSALEIRIPLNEANLAQLNISENLSAWSNYHLGLQHMYRFTMEDNAKATRLFEKAVMQDPRFARAHAGLSFTSFQDAFMKYTDTPDAALNARRFAERSVELDALDPFSNLALGRSFWLQGELESSTIWLDRSISLNPNYSHGHYSHAFSDVMSCQVNTAVNHAKTAFALSPLDPFVYAMFGVRALSFVIAGEYNSAAEWAEKAARSPGAHFLIAMIAVLAYSLVNNPEKARFWVANVRARRPDASQHHFFASFPFDNDELRDRISHALSAYGL